MNWPKRITYTNSLNNIAYKKNVVNNQKKVQYVTLIFSDRQGRPTKKFRPTGFGGFIHNADAYLKQLQKLSILLNRKCVFPPPWVSLSRMHNHRKYTKNNWDTYINTSEIQNLEMHPPFLFENNGDISSRLSKKYYPNGISIDNIDNTSDIIVFVNFNSSFTKIYGYLNINKRLNHWERKKIAYLNGYRHPTSNILKKYANKIISELNLKNFTFVHIRRGDFLDNRILAPPEGTRPYTSPEFISKFIKSKTENNKIFIATNENDLNYKNKLVDLLENYEIIFEHMMFKYLPDGISNDNYCIYLISHEIAKKSNINIGTHGYTRLGNKNQYLLSNG